MEGLRGELKVGVAEASAGSQWEHSAYGATMKAVQWSPEKTHDAYASDDEDDPLKRTPKMENDGNATVLRAPNCYNQFTEKETAVIMERYIENYEAYHNKQLGKFGESVGGKKKFLASLTEEVNSIGVSVRTEKQIDQKIRDEMKTVKKYAKAVKQEQLRTGGGCAVLPRITRVQKELREQLIEAELKNAQLRRENLLMEQQVLEANLAYWNEKRRSYFAGTAV
ncbi:unnamed protein product [Heligmosomoides polygyrus]|uniref:Transposase, Ptta/En/Spm, plant n=1 Tax=Heligmosomoides polygyrus TaxID=6339 RepID=A0A3P8D1V3_HELPZ|nr:unnamed protein product [Heligmosomoides polygyrus]